MSFGGVVSSWISCLLFVCTLQLTLCWLNFLFAGCSLLFLLLSVWFLCNCFLVVVCWFPRSFVVFDRLNLNVFGLSSKCFSCEQVASLGILCGLSCAIC